MSTFEDPQQALLRSPVYGVITGQLLGFNKQRQPLVVFPGQEGTAALIARTIANLHNAAFGCDVLLQFEQGDVNKPIVLGVIQQPDALAEGVDTAQMEVEADGQRIKLEAKQQLVLRCGEASITLTKAGKVLIQGNYLSSRATGTHRIKGGCVQIN